MSMAKSNILQTNTCNVMHSVTNCHILILPAINIKQSSKPAFNLEQFHSVTPQQTKYHIIYKPELLPTTATKTIITMLSS